MKSEEHQKLDQENVTKAWLLLNSTILLDLYAEENVIFGHIENGEKVLFDRYLSDLGLPLFPCGEMKSRILDKGVIYYGDIEKLYYEVYDNKVNYIFDGARISKEFDDDEIYHYKYDIRILKRVIRNLREIMTTEIKPDLYATVPDILDKEELRAYYFKATRFVKAIKLKKLKQCNCVDRYVKDLPFLSPFIMRLLIKRKGRYLLKNNNTDSLDYRLALFSCFRFYNENNAKLFELKMLRWEEPKKACGCV